ASVASFFISRIDSAVDAKLDELGRRDLQGKAAIANAKLTYARFEELFADPRWDALAAQGAQTQRVLWASTGTKSPAYSDVLYVEELTGAAPATPARRATYDAFRDHGKVRPSLDEDVDGARDTMAALAEAGIDFEAITAALLDDAVRLFEEAFDTL